MGEKKQLAIVEQKEVELYGDDVTAVRGNDGHIYVSVASLCAALGIDVQAQTRRIRRSTVLADGLTSTAILTVQVQKGVETSQQRAVNVLRHDLIALWLSGISTRSISDDIVRAKLENFQRNAARVLHEAFERGELSTDEGFDELLKQADNEAVEAYQMLQAMIKMARSHVVLSAKVDNHETRLSLVEARLGDKSRHLTMDQASRIQSAVSAIAFQLGKHSGGNEFAGVWKEVYRRFDIPDYRSLPAARFDEAIDFLRQWWESITDESNVPF